MNEVLLAGLWQGALITAIAAAITFFVPQRHAATRYAIWFSALLALAALPLAALWHPASFSMIPPSVEDTVAATSAATGRAADAGGSVLFFAWLTGVAFCTSRLAFSYVRIRQIVHRATPAPQLGAGVLLSDELATPIAAGFVHGVILIPRGLAEMLEPDDIASIVRHERAHVTRHDLTGNLVQRCIEALLFFNPWAYVIGRALVKEREAACDDWVVHFGAAPERYASCLATLARNEPTRTPLLTPSAIGSRRMLVGRIARILNGKATQLRVNYVTLTGTIAAFTLLAAALQTSNAIALASPLGDSVRIVASNSCNHPAKVVNPAAPTYPDVKTKLDVSANVLVTIAPDGKIVSTRIVKSSGNAAVDRATLEAARHSTYAPAVDDCKATVGQYVFRAKFNSEP